jgi:beta-phosphoglucomutase-like phosphatase (HAD superfamily)
MLTDHLIDAVAAAGLALAEAAAVHERDTEEAARLHGRIEQCAARQAEITARRLTGKSTAEETAEYAALNGDIAVLNDLHREAQARAMASNPQHEAAALANAQFALEEHKEQAAFENVVEHARAAERVYVQCLHAVWMAALERGNLRTFGDAFQIDSSIMNLCRLNSWGGLSR